MPRASSGGAEIEAAMAERGTGDSKDNPHLALRAALMARAEKEDIDPGELGRRSSCDRERNVITFCLCLAR